MSRLLRHRELHPVPHARTRARDRGGDHEPDRARVPGVRGRGPQPPGGEGEEEGAEEEERGAVGERRRGGAGSAAVPTGDHESERALTVLEDGWEMLTNSEARHHVLWREAY